MAGETALARQLKKLAVPQTSLLLQNKLRKSLLFDHRFAATLDRDVVFAHGICGLEKLEEINSQFCMFKQNLFSNNYAELERSVQTETVNKKLNDKITVFLQMLSPYFLNAAAAQALEWLVYRYHIHMYNADALIAAALPHYNTPHFVRVVQLLNLEEENSRWAWLKPVQKSGIPLEYPVILNRFLSDLGFMKFVCDLAPNTLRVYKASPSVASPVISFSMQTMYNALDKNISITDTVVFSYIPYLLKGVKSKFNKYSASSYLVLANLVTKVKLDNKFLTELLTVVFQNVSDDLLSSAYELLLLVFQQQPIKSINKDLFYLLVSSPYCMKHLTYLVNWDSESLLKALMKQSISTYFEVSIKGIKKLRSIKVKKFTRRILFNIELSEKCATLCLKIIIKHFLRYRDLIKNKKSLMLKYLFQSSRKLLKLLEVKYPDSFDKAVNLYLNSTDGKDNQRLSQLINSSICNVKNTVLPNSQTTLILGLNHANENIRKIAVRFLLKKTSANKVTDVDFIGDILYLKLIDKSSSVVEELLKFPDVITQYVEKPKLLSAFVSILRKKIKKKSCWYPVQMSCIDILCNYFVCEEYSLETFVALLPFIFPVRKSSIEGYFKVMNSELKNVMPIVQAVDLQELENEELENIDISVLANLNYSFVCAIDKYLCSLSKIHKSLFLSFLAKECSEISMNNLYVIYVLSAGNDIILEDTTEKMLVKMKELLCFFKKLLTHPTLNFEFMVDISQEEFFKSVTRSLKKDQFPFVVIYFELCKIVQNMKLNFHVINIDEWLKSNKTPQFESFQILVQLFDFCMNQLNCNKPSTFKAFQLLLSKFISYQFPTIQYLFYFLSTFWSNVLYTIPYVIQMSSLLTGISLCKVPCNFSWFFESDVLCLSLLKAVSSSKLFIRDTAMSLLSELLLCSENSNHPWKHLCAEIKKHSEEIKMDCSHCYSVVSNWLCPVLNKMVEAEVKCANLSVDSDSDAKYSVLETFIRILSDDSTPNIIKHEILLYLHQLDSVSILSAYIPILNRFINQFKENELLIDVSTLDIVNLLLQKFTPKTAVRLVQDSKETDSFLECLTLNQDTLTEKNIQLFALNVLSKDFFTSIPSDAVQKKLLDTLLDLYATSSSHMNAAVKKVLSKLSTYAYLVLKDFQGCYSPIRKVSTLKDVKKSRTKTIEESSISLERNAWKKLCLLLELMQNKSKLDKKDLLIPELFTILNKTLNTDSQSSVEYLRQLILSTIYNCCQQLGSSGLDETQFQVELVVQCIRCSRNPKTHQSSLLLLNLAATLFPDHVLNNVMSIFTFMGSSLIRQDDSYSFQVISQTIETIVPSLLEASSHQKDSDPVQVVAEVIRVFVDSLADIPRHRQMPLFTKLITNLDPSRFLWIPLGQICDQYATMFHDVISEDINNWKVSPTLEFAVNLHKQFSPVVQIDTCINLLNFLALLPDKKEESNQVNRTFKEPFNVLVHSNQQLQIYKHNVLSYINIWLSSHEFISQVSELDMKAQYDLEEKYVLLLEKALNYLQHQRSIDKEKRTKGGHKLFRLLFDLVCHVNSLLPTNLFIRVLRTLLENSETEIRNKTVEILNAKLEQQQHSFTEENHKHLLKLLKPLLNVINNYNSSSSKDRSCSISQQTILYTLHLLTKIVGPTYPSKFHKVLNVTVQILSNSQNPELTVNALLCLAQLCCSLNVEVLPQLNVFMPIIVDLLTDNKILEMNDCLALGIITAIQSLIENVGSFLSSYLQPLVTGICLLSSQCQETSKKVIQSKILVLQTLIAKNIPLRILLTSLENSYASIMIICPQAVVPLTQILDEKLNSCSYEEIQACLIKLETFFISMLDFRFIQSKNSKISFQLICSAESNIVSALKTFVMKLSVNLFEKFFRKIFQWVSNIEDFEQKCRIYTFYNLSSQLSESLKSLFVVVAKCFLKNASSTLDSVNCSKNEDLLREDPNASSEVLKNVLVTLNNCFVYSDGHLLDKENFELLMQPLIDQLENYSDSHPEVYKDRISQQLSGCIAHFMAAVSDNTLWKKCNYQILLKTRHNSAVVRFATIQVIREVVKVMSDNYLVLLPESIPFLAEVLEDESSEVEQECKSVILEMEKILGVPISSNL